LPLAAALALAASGAAAGREAWWHTAWKYRILFDVPPGRSGLPGSDVGVATFLTAGRLKDDASDLRVVVDGVPTPHLILVDRPKDDVLRVAFALRGGERTAAFYFGNPRAKAIPRAPRIERGCLLQIFDYRGGSPDNLQAMRGILKRSERYPQGADFVPNIFYGINPFGPSVNFVSRYTGWLACPQTGTYTFATSSDDASFLLVDDKLTVQWPGWHRAVPDSRHQRRLHLTRGLHKIEYLHVQGKDQTCAVAAWQPPGQDRIIPIPPDAFAPVARCSIRGIEKLGGSGAAHFEVEVVGECFYAKNVSLRVRLRDLSSTKAPGNPRWEFGDGLAGSGAEVEHVYLRPGVYTVTMTPPGPNAEPVTSRVMIRRMWGAQALAGTDKPRRIAALVRGYDFDRLVPGSLPAAAFLFKEIEALADEERVLRAVVTRSAEVEDRTYFEAVLFLVKRWRDDKASRADALRLLDLAESRLSRNANLRARVIRERGDVLFYYERSLDDALAEYDKVVGRFAEKLEDHIVRITKIRIGDIYRKKGNHDRALEAYTAAEKYRIQDIRGAPEVRRGSLFQIAEAAIAKNRADQAAQALDAIAWEFPAEKLGGQLSILRARVAMLRRDRTEALVQLDDLVRVSPASNEAAEALFLAAEIERTAGHTAEAVRRYERIVAEYRDSPRASDAALRLKRMSTPNGKR
jgi:tetratricopeptide (TPR) repeat protein